MEVKGCQPKRSKALRRIQNRSMPTKLRNDQSLSGILRLCSTHLDVQCFEWDLSFGEDCFEIRHQSQKCIFVTLAFREDLQPKSLHVEKDIFVIFDSADLFPHIFLRDARRGGVELEFVFGVQEGLDIVVHAAADEEESVAVSGFRLLQACFCPAPDVAIDVQRSYFS